MDERLTPDEQALLDLLLDCEAHPERYQCRRCGVPFTHTDEVRVRREPVTRAIRLVHLACEPYGPGEGPKTIVTPSKKQNGHVGA